jgi:hypothetical protein
VSPTEATGDTGLATAARQAFTDGMAAVLTACAALAVLGALAVASWLPARPTAVATESVHEPTRSA